MTKKMILSIVGARPQFVKAAIVSKALAENGLAEQVIHTGQHYDEAMSESLLRQLGMTNIVANFGVGSGSHAHQTASIMTKLDDFLEAHPEIAVVMVYGDTNSTLAAGVVASKRGLPIVHVEAGLRSYNRSMPEEINRVLVDHLSETLFCSSTTGVENLQQEGVTQGVFQVGDVMLDAFQHYSPIATAQSAAGELLTSLGSQDFGVVTIHRPGNTDDEDRFQAIVKAIAEVGVTCLWPIHPRIKSRRAELAQIENLVICDPVSYFQMLELLQKCKFVITDSGGLQKEVHWAKKRCVTFRPETEWTETLEGGWNTLFDPVRQGGLSDLLNAALDSSTWNCLYGDGQASARIAKQLAEKLG